MANGDGKVVMLDPAEILADDNSRFGLRPAALEALKADIMALGRIHTPVGVSPLTKEEKAKNKGKTHRLNYGFYRVAAALDLNKSEKAGLKVPAIVTDVAEGADRLREQLSENLARQDMSPMDKAVAMKRLMDAGVPRPTIRDMFATVVGKKREPLSNSSLNIHLHMLDLPKGIQEDIHNGVVGVKAAYELGKVPADKRQAVIDRAKAEVAHQAEIEAKDEEKYLAAEKRVADLKAQEEAKVKEAEEAKAEVERAKQTLEARKEEYAEAKKAFNIDDLKEKGQKAMEPIKAAETNVKEAEKLVKKAQNKVAKLLSEATKAADAALGSQKKLDASKAKGKKKANGKKVAAVSDTDVKKAAKAEKVTESSNVQLTAAEIRQALKDVIKAADKAGHTKVSAIAQHVKDCFDGKDTPKELGIALAKVTGEGK